MRWLALVLLAACGVDRDAPRADSDASDTSDTETRERPPHLAEHRARPLLWLRVFMLNEARDALLTPVRRPDGAFLARVELANGDVTIGPRIDEDDQLELYASRAPDVWWMFGDDGPRLSALDVETLTLGAALELPDESYRTASWSGDGTAVALAHGDADGWRGIYRVVLPDDPATFTGDEDVLDVPLVADTLRLRVTSGGTFLVTSGGPDRQVDPQCSGTCIEELDPATARFDVYDLRAPAIPIASEVPHHDATFRVSLSGRWLFRDTAAGVVGHELLAAGLVPRATVCRSVGGLAFTPRGTICASAQGDSYLHVLDDELAVVTSAPLLAIHDDLVTSPDGDFALAGDEVVDLRADPPEVHRLLGPALPDVRIADDTWVWAYDQLSGNPLVRLEWASRDRVTFPIPDIALMTQLEGLPDGGFVLSRILGDDLIEVWSGAGARGPIIERQRD